MRECAAITGLGVVSPLGVGLEPLRQRIAARGARSVPGEAESGRRVAPEDTGFERFVSRKQRKLIDPLTAMAIGAAGQAMTDAAIPQPDWSAFDVGVFGAAAIRSAGGGAATALPRVERLRGGSGPIAKRLWEAYNVCADPMDLLRRMTSAPGDQLCVSRVLRGPVCTFLGGGSAGAVALREAARRLTRAERRAMVVLASDSGLDPWRVALRERRRTPGSRSTEEAAGLPSEGGAALVVEPESAALGRGARVYARVRGSVVRLPPAAGGASAAERALRAVLEHAGCSVEGITRVVSCGGGRVACDPDEERAALDTVLGRTHPAQRWWLPREVGDFGCAAVLLGVALGAAWLAEAGGRAGGEGPERVLVLGFGDAGDAAAVLLEGTRCSSASTS